MQLYREFTTQDELDREYNPSAALPDLGGILARWQAASEAAASSPGCRLGVRYGPTLAEHLDIFPADAGADVHIFIHGGYWRRFAARDFAFLGPPLNRAGYTLVNVNYDLCPRVTIDEIVREVRAAIAWIYEHIGEFGGAADRLTVSGHSAGGHLTAMALATDWPGEYGLPADVIKAAMPISGLFDLAPFPYTYLQPALQLSWGQVRRNSPLHLVARPTGPVTVAVGGAESNEFRRQSQTYAQQLLDRGFAVTYAEIPGRNHFDVLDGFVEPDGALVSALRAIARPG